MDTQLIQYLEEYTKRKTSGDMAYKVHSILCKIVENEQGEREELLLEEKRRELDCLRVVPDYQELKTTQSTFPITIHIRRKGAKIIEDQIQFRQSMGKKEHIYFKLIFYDTYLQQDKFEIFSPMLKIKKKSTGITDRIHLYSFDFLPASAYYYKDKKEFQSEMIQARKQVQEQQDLEKFRQEITEGVDILEGISHPMEALQQLVGLENVKKQIKTIQDRMKFQKLLEEKGEQQVRNFNNHMVFYGSPGTGKTTVARIMAGLLYELNVIEKNQCIQVNGEQLKGQYVGHTAKKVQTIINYAQGGILFIDESYALLDKYYGKEAVNVLLQNMEDKKDRLIVIFAGYENEMKEFIGMNPGLKSRIANYIKFDNYNPDELLQIFQFSLEKRGFQIHEDALEKVRIALTFAYHQNYTQSTGGNARFVENYVNKILDRHASNVVNGMLDLNTQLKIINECDV